MAGATLPAMYDARLFTIVAQQLGVGHGLHRSSLNFFPGKQWVSDGEKTIKTVLLLS